jgi:hypothetical protein
MIRRWHVEPDMEAQTQDGLVLAVSRDALIMAAVDAVTMADRAGGGFQMWLERYPTGLPGEMITTGAVVEWRHRTDARPENEQQTRQVPQTVEPPPTEMGYDPPPEQDDPTQFRDGEFVGDDINDGIDPNALPEEDDSEVGEPVS